MSFIALDTEFVWQSTYYANLGLIQVAMSPDFNTSRLPSEPPSALAFPANKTTSEYRAVRLLDPLQTDPATISVVLRDAAVVKILHDAEQDLQHIRRWCGASPVNVFDTRIAAGFCGMASTLSLRQLLKDVAEIDLPKTETRTDWMRRPLSPKQLAYAADDVVHLGHLMGWLLEKARKLGTLNWMLEEMQGLDDPRRYEENGIAEAWRRVKVPIRAFRTPRQLLRLRELAAWREKTARDCNLPRRWVIDDKVLVEAALNPPREESALLRRDLPKPLVQAFFKTLATAESLPEEDIPKLGDTATTAVRDAATGLLKTLTTIATEVHIDAALLCSRTEALSFCQNPDDPDHPLNNGWRTQIAGRDAHRALKPR